MIALALLGVRQWLVGRVGRVNVSELGSRESSSEYDTWAGAQNCNDNINSNIDNMNSMNSSNSSSMHDHQSVCGSSVGCSGAVSICCGSGRPEVLARGSLMVVTPWPPRSSLMIRAVFAFVCVFVVCAVVCLACRLCLVLRLLCFSPLSVRLMHLAGLAQSVLAPLVRRPRPRHRICLRLCFVMCLRVRRLCSLRLCPVSSGQSLALQALWGPPTRLTQCLSCVPILRSIRLVQCPVGMVLSPVGRVVALARLALAFARSRNRFAFVLAFSGRLAMQVPLLHPPIVLASCLPVVCPVSPGPGSRIQHASRPWLGELR